MTAPKTQKLLSRKDVLAKVSLSYATIWKRMQTGEFPRSREYGGKCLWIESEIDKWIDELPNVKLKGDAA